MSESRQVGTLVRRLEQAAADHDEARQRVEDAGEAKLQRLADHYEELTGLMDRYEPVATSDGDTDVDMEQFIEYQEKLARFVERLPEDLPHREAFEAVDEIMHQKWLKQADFAEARETIAEVGSLVDRLDERDRARDRYREARSAVQARLDDVEDRIDDLERLVELGEADLDAPVERLRDPIERYNDAVTDAFSTFKHDASAREVLDFVAATDSLPLVQYRQPPEDLREYVTDADAGTESISQLLEYADYSTSKLDHYVDDADALKRHVATHQTYLQRLSADPLTVSWPPSEASELRFRCRELIPAVDRIADEAVLEPLRTVRSLADREEYDRLRDSALARTQLTDEERQRLQDGAVQAELQSLREERDRLQDALEEYGPR